MLKKHFEAHLAVYMALVFDYLLMAIILIYLAGIANSGGIEFFNSNFGSPVMVLTAPFFFIFYFTISGCYKKNSLHHGLLPVFAPLTPLFVALAAPIGILLVQPGIPGQHLSLVYQIAGMAVLFCVIAIISRLFARNLYLIFLKRGIIKRELLLVFPRPPGQGYQEEIERYARLHHMVITGYCANHALPLEGFTRAIPLLGKYADAGRVANDMRVKEILILRDNGFNPQTTEILRGLVTSDILIRLAPQQVELLTANHNGKDFNSLPVVTIGRRRLTATGQLLKRLLDLTVSIPGLLITGALFPFISYLVKRNSPGPVLFKQERVGLNEEPFNLYKFRTMYLDAEKSGPSLASRNGDPRVIPGGLMLRKLHVDELPQFWNIFKGDMSFVGPRPERAFYASQLIEKEPYYNFVTTVKPGLTSLGMIKFGYAHNLKEMMERMVYDVTYINNNSLLLDLKISVNTVIYFIKKAISRKAKLKEGYNLDESSVAAGSNHDDKHVIGGNKPLLEQKPVTANMGNPD